MIRKSRKQRIHTFLFLFFILSPLSQAAIYHWKTIDAEFDSIAAILDSSPSPHAESNKELLKRLETISLQRNNAMLNIRYRYWNAYLNGDQWNNTENENSKTNYLIETLSYLDTTRYDYDFARILFLLLSNPNSTPNYLQQYQQLSEIIPIFKKHEDLLYEGNCYRYLGILFAELSQYDQAIGYFDKADQCYKLVDDKSALVSNASNRAVLLYYMGKEDSSIQLFQKLLKDSIIQNRPGSLISIYINLTLACTSEEERSAYEDSVLSLLDRYPEAAGSDYKNGFLVNRAHHFQQIGMYDSSIMLYEEVLRNASEEGLQNITLTTLYGLSACFEKKGDFKKAYDYLFRFQVMQDSLKGSGKIGEINRIETGMAITEYQNRLSIQEQKMALQKKLSVLITVSITLLAVILLIILFYLRQKKKLAETRLQNKELHNQKLQQEIDHQNRELSTSMLILSENRNFLQQILAQLEKLRSKGEMTNPCELELRKMITGHIQSEDEWESFKIHFEKVHPDFFNKLKKKHAALTTNDLKLCAYIRIGLNIKQISQMTAVLPATIKTNRYLLKKKLNLEESLSLDDYIASV